MYVNLFSGVALVTKNIVIKINPFGIYDITMISMATLNAIQKNGVFGDSNEQFGSHEKLSPTSTINVNCMKHDPIDLIYNFTLS